MYRGPERAHRLRGGQVEYKLFAVRVFVTDWKRAIRFYSETLGMTIAYQRDEMGWAQMAPGEGQLALERVDPSDEEGRALVGRSSVCPFRSLTSLRHARYWRSAVSSSLAPRRSSHGVVCWPISATPMETS
jgi:hypothetical protein